MNKLYSLCIPTLFTLILSGCSVIGDKSLSASVIYVATTIISFLILVLYISLTKKKSTWFLLLFASIFVVNIGYLTLSISTDINEALLANRISYLGSVFLPMSMLMLILDECNFNYKKWVPILLTCIGIPVFLIAASPGYLDIYYKSVSLVTQNGFTTLVKEYGPLHSIYLYYLVGYFLSMIAIIAYSTVKKKINSTYKCMILFIAVFINIGIWLLEQLVHIEFEMLSLSYIASEMFLLGLNISYPDKNTHTTAKNETEIQFTDFTSIETPVDSIEKTVTTDSIDVTSNEVVIEAKNEEDIFAEQCEYFASQIKNLTPTEHAIYELYIAKKSTKEVLDILSIKETTLKYHNKNIYSKLGVTSKRQLLEIASVILK